MKDGPASVDARQEPDAKARSELSNLQGLLVLSMLMTERGDEHDILDLAASSVPSLGQAVFVGVYSFDFAWRAAAGAGADESVREKLESQFSELTSAGGAIAIPGHAWGHAFPLRGLEGHFGYLIVGAEEQPPAVEQFLLRVLSQQTGIALANARLHTRERATASELRTTNATLASTLAALQQSTAIHTRLTRVAAAGEGQQGIADAIHDLTGFSVAIEDRHGNLRAWAGPGRPEPYPKDAPDRRAAMLRRARLADGPIREGDRLIMAAHPQEDVLGVLALIDPATTADEPARVALEHGTTVLGLELARLQSVAESELRVGRDLVEDLLAGTDESAFVRAQALAYDLQRPHRVVVVDCRGHLGDDGAFFHAVRRASRDAGVGSLLVVRNGAVVVLSDADQPWEEFRLRAQSEMGHGRCRVGVGGRCELPSEFPRSYREARIALKIQDVSGAGDHAVEFSRLGVYQLLADVEQPDVVERFARDWLGALIEYDTNRRAELVLTLHRYLECGGNYDATAEALSLHRNTLKYRLQRIREISGHNLGDADTLFNLQLATRIWQTLMALRSEPA